MSHRTLPLHPAWLLAGCLAAGAAHAQEWVYTVVPGDNLWDLSERYLDRVTRFEALRRINNVENPRRIPPGTRLRVPMEWIVSNPVPAAVAEAEGPFALIRAAGETLRTPPAGTPLHLGDQLETGPESSIAVRFADGTLVTVHPQSVVRFDHLSAHGETGMVDSRLRLLQGRAESRVEPAVGPGSRFEIHTPAAVSAVRGTEYRTVVTDDGQGANIEVLRGRVAVAGGGGETLVADGFGTRVEADRAPLAPRPLLPAPRFEALPEPVRQVDWPVSWAPLERAVAYRAEVARGAEFTTVLWQHRGRHPRVALPDLPDGTYFVRVRGVDDLGIEGRDAARAVTLDARPQPPVPLHPEDGRVLREEVPELHWTASAEAARYRVEIATDPDFRDGVLVREELTGTRYRPGRALAVPAGYFWRLTSIAGDGEVGPPGPTRRWEVKAIPEAVVPGLDAADDGLLVASWNPGPPGQTYQVQLAADAEFTEQVFDRHTPAPETRFEPVSGQVRYLRVRAVADDGYRGPWGTVQRVDPLPDQSFWAIPILTILGILFL